MCACACVQLQVKLLCILLVLTLSLYLCAGSAIGNVSRADGQEVLHTEGSRLAACNTMPTQPAQSSSPCQPQPMPSPLLHDSFVPQPMPVPPQLASPSPQGLLPSPQLSAPPPQPAISSVKIMPSPEVPQLHQDLSTASPQLPKASPESHWASTEVPKASLNPLTASPVQQPPLPQQPSLLQAQGQFSRPPSSPPVTIMLCPARHRGLPAKDPEPLVVYDSSEDSGCDSDPHWGFSVADVLTSDDEDTDDELQADLRALRAEAMRPDRHISRRRPASLSHRPNHSESALRVGGRALQGGGRSSFPGAGARMPDTTAQAAASGPQSRAAAPGPAAKSDASALVTALRAGNDASASGHNRVPGALTGPPVDVSALRASDTVKGTDTPQAAASGPDDAKAAANGPSGVAFMHRVRIHESNLRAAASALDIRADATTAEAVPCFLALAAEAEGIHMDALEASPIRPDACPNASATSTTHRADAGALNMPTAPAFLTQHAQQEEFPHQAPETKSADTAQLSDEDSAGSLQGDLPPWDSELFWQADSSVWDDAHEEAAQTYELCDDSSQAHGSAAVGSSGADAATATAAVGGRDAAVAVHLLDPRCANAIQELHSSSQAVLASSMAVSPPAVVSEVDTQLVHSSQGRQHCSKTTELAATSSSEEHHSSPQSDRSRAAASSPDDSSSVRAQPLAAVGMAGHHDDIPDLSQPHSGLQNTAANDTDSVMPEQEVTEQEEQEDEGAGAGGYGEECRKELHDGTVVDSSPGYIAWLAGSMLKRGEGDAHSRGGQMAPLGNFRCPKS